MNRRSGVETAFSPLQSHCASVSHYTGGAFLASSVTPASLSCSGLGGKSDLTRGSSVVIDRKTKVCLSRRLESEALASSLCRRHHCVAFEQVHLWNASAGLKSSSLLTYIKRLCHVILKASWATSYCRLTALLSPSMGKAGGSNFNDKRELRPSGVNTDRQLVRMRTEVSNWRLRK